LVSVWIRVEGRHVYRSCLMNYLHSAGAEILKSGEVSRLLGGGARGIGCRAFDTVALDKVALRDFRNGYPESEMETDLLHSACYCDGHII
jgi:hypothetical protein